MSKDKLEAIVVFSLLHIFAIGFSVFVFVQGFIVEDNPFAIFFSAMGLLIPVCFWVEWYSYKKGDV